MKKLLVLLGLSLLFGSSAYAYTVKSGDTLSQIAKDNGTTWQVLAEENNLENPNPIFPGQEIRMLEVSLLGGTTSTVPTNNPSLKGNNTWTGSNTFSATTTLNGAVNGILDSIYGDGSDGITTITTGTTTLSRDMYYQNLTITGATTTIVTNGYRIYATGTIANAGKIIFNGNKGTNGTAGSGGGGGGAGGTALNSGSLFGSLVGTSGGGGTNSGAGGAGGSGGVEFCGLYTNTTAVTGGTGGTGAAGGGAGGTKGTLYVSSSTPNSFYNILSFKDPTTTTPSFYRTHAVSGAGGGGGAPNGGVNVSGGGGGSGSNGGTIWISARTLTNTGTIEVKGGSGGNGGATAGDGGGGGGGAGGSGGTIFIIYQNLTIGTTDVTGGAGGSAGAGGTGATAGTAGQSGYLITKKL